jgi:hypothetical protein
VCRYNRADHSVTLSVNATRNLQEEGLSEEKMILHKDQKLVFRAPSNDSPLNYLMYYQDEMCSFVPTPQLEFLRPCVYGIRLSLRKFILYYTLVYDEERESYSWPIQNVDPEFIRFAKDHNDANLPITINTSHGENPACKCVVYNAACINLFFGDSQCAKFTIPEEAKQMMLNCRQLRYK